MNAAGSGCVPLMSLLREHGCAWDATAFVAAVKSGSEEAVLWLRENGCPLPVSTVRPGMLWRLLCIVPKLKHEQPGGACT